MDTEVKCERGTYGHYTDGCPGVCEWLESCKLYSNMSNPESSKRIRNAVNIEKTEHRLAGIPERQYPADDEAGKESFSFLSELLTYLVNLDDNTALAVLDILRNPDASQSDIARQRGVSRQRVNTSLLHACKKHPELASLFSICIRRYTVLKNRYASEKPALPYDQLDLFKDN